MPHSTLGEKLESQRLWWNKQLDVRAFLVFQRLLRFYNTFVILSALISGLAVAALTFPDFHPSTSGVGEVGEGLLCSSAVTGVLSAVMATMLLFAFEGFERATRTDLAVAWSPLVLLDISIVEFLVGIVCWYWAKNVAWRGALVAVELGSLMGCCVALSVWVWLRLSAKGGLGLEERQRSVEQGRAADA
ncbi:unnamed protein product [Colletotrichum noveboracense]|uniref:Uncharacterized protein n=1 Tax=Colletotrichum noveboracense TaxID=2664923 RepID=A0A9W4RJI7_9PEZI|nr:unnamed protein product [Colletotrichum noveboracense]